MCVCEYMCQCDVCGGEWVYECVGECMSVSGSVCGVCVMCMGVGGMCVGVSVMCVDVCDVCGCVSG